MEQQETDRQTAILKQVLANMADKRLHVYELQNLVNYYPQSNLLYVLNARTGDAEQIKSAVVYYNSPGLYRFVHQQEPLPQVNPDQIINLDDIEPEPIITLEPPSMHSFENYEPTIEDLALAEINKRKFGSETNWTSFDLDAEEVQEQLYEPGQLTYQPEEQTVNTENTSHVAEPAQPEAEPLVSEEPVVVVPDAGNAEQQVFPDDEENAHDFQHDWYQQDEGSGQATFSSTQNNYQDASQNVESSQSLSETQNYERLTSNGSQWQSLNFEEFDNHQQPVVQETESAGTTVSNEFIGAEPEVFAPQIEEQPTTEQYTFRDQTEQTAGIEPEVFGTAQDIQVEAKKNGQAVTFEDKTATAFIPYMQKAEQEIFKKETPAEASNSADTAIAPEPKEGSEIEDEIFDEIVGIEDIFIAHVPKSVSPFVPPVTVPGTTSPAQDSFEQKSGDTARVNVDEVVQRVEQAAADMPIAEEIPVQPEAVSDIQQEPQADLVDSRVEEAANEDDVQTPEVQPEPTTEEKPVLNHPLAEFDSLIAESIVSADYFSYRQSLVKEEPAPAPQQPVKEVPPVTDEKQVVTKYHDDSMPYSFLWWLDKTRRDHAAVYQPYAKPSQLPSMEELQQEKQPPIQLAEPKKKEENIIERFIKEEPQIKPPSSDKLDNENKARNSAEDSDEIVTETLARIYVDQMLYHKAIATYKKLMLRFPEKNSYFASQIKELENKIN